MTIFKAKNYNVIKNEMNMGEAVAVQEVRNGYVGKVVERYVDTSVTPNVTYDRAFVPLVAADLTKDNIWVATFTPLKQDYEEVKKPDMTFHGDYLKRKGEQVRLINVALLQQAEFEFTSNIVKTDYAAVNLGNVLIPAVDGSMLWEAAATATKAGMKVLAKDNLETTLVLTDAFDRGSFHTQVITQ
jgi:hypothetical protein